MKGKGLNLLAGYNTMSESQKEKYDKKALGRFTGWMIIAFSFILAFAPIGVYLEINWLIYSAIIISLAEVLVCMIYVNKSKRFRKRDISEVSVVADNEKSKPSSNKKVIIAVVTIAALILIGIGINIGIMMQQGSKDPVIILHDNSIQIKAMYGVTINFSDITEISLIDKSMREIGVGKRTNGYGGIGETLKGNFKSDRAGETLLFVQYNSTPTIKIVRVNDKDVYISFRDNEKTKDVFEEIKTHTQSPLY